MGFLMLEDDIFILNQGPVTNFMVQSQEYTSPEID